MAIIKENLLNKALKYLLLATAVTPLIYAPSLVFPFVLGKALFFRTIIELALILFAVCLVFSQNSFFEKLKKLAKNPLFLLTLLFFVSAAISTVFAVNSYRAFWGDIERSEGLLTLAHFLLFFIMAAVVFEKKDWLSFFKISLIVGGVMIFYSLLQFLGTENFPFAFNARKRPNAFLGNSSYSGLHFLFTLALAAIVFIKAYRKSFWRYFSLSLAILSLVFIFLTATRGVIVGLAAALIFFLIYYFKNVLASKKVLGVVLLLVILAAAFFLTKQALFWQAIPGIDRIAKISLADATVQTRLLSFGTSWSAFKERPLFGWGLENFNIAYNKYFNPDYSLYEAAWFDRAHNKIADVLVMQGLLGLISYLGIFIAAFWLLLKKNKTFSGAVLSGLLIAYFIQNLFIFDQIVSYLMFFAVLGYVSAGTLESGESFPQKQSGLILPLSAVALIIFSIAGFFYYNFIPYRQATAFNNLQTNERDARVIFDKMDSFLLPYNFTQLTIRNSLFDFLVQQDAFTDSKLNFLTDRAFSAMEELAEKERYEPRVYIRLAEAYNDRFKTEPEFLKKSEETLRKALELTPKRQDVYYHLSYALAAQGKIEKAIETAKFAVDLSPDVGRSHYILGVILSLAGDEYRLEGEREIEKSFNMRGQFLRSTDYDNLIAIYSANIILHAKNRDLERLITAANRFKEFKPELSGEMDIIIERARSGQWESLLRALGA